MVLYSVQCMVFGKLQGGPRGVVHETLLLHTIEMNSG